MYMNRLCWILTALIFTADAKSQHLEVSAGQQLEKVTIVDGRKVVKPFVWIGDTAWELFHVLDREAASYYLETRAAQGFTVIHAVLLAENSGLNTPNAYGHFPLLNGDPERPDLRYFELVDYVVNKAQDLGLFMAILPTWGDKVINNRKPAEADIFTEKNAWKYGSFLGRRYAGKPVIWVLGGDRNIENSRAAAIWNNMASAIRAESGGRQLMTYHPAGESSSAYWWHNASWLDFNMFQSGHARKAMPVYETAAWHRLLLPVKPFIDGEPAYEDIPIKFWLYTDKEKMPAYPRAVTDKDGIILDTSWFRDGFFTAEDLRRQAYWGVLSGALGYNYGNNAVWQMFEKGKKNVLPAMTTWRQALHRPGAMQIRHLRYVMERWDFSRLVPNQSLVYGINRSGPNYICAAMERDQQFLLLYTPVWQRFSINLTSAKHPNFKALWFDPVAGKLIPSNTTFGRGIHLLQPPPGEQDWLLVLEGI